MDNKKRTVVSREYVPEYKRLGMKPMEYPVRDPEEFAKYKKKAIAEKQQTNKQNGFLALRQAYREGRLSKEELESIVGPVQEDAVVEEKRARYVSGQETDQQWTKALVSKEEEEELKINKGQIYYDDVDLPPELEKSPAMKAVEEDDEDESSFSLDNIQINEYVLLYKDGLVEQGSKKRVLAALSSVLEEEGIDKAELVLLKRLNINYGISIDD